MAQHAVDTQPADTVVAPAELAERARHAEPNHDLLERAETGARIREAEANAVRRRRRLRRVLLFAFTVLTVTAGFAAWLLAPPPPAPAVQLQSPPPRGVVLRSETVSQTHVTRQLIVHLGDEGSWGTQLLVFDQNRFLRNRVALINPTTLEVALQGLRDDLRNKWIVIFAAASIEGDDDYNLQLCRDRVAAVVGMLRAHLSGTTTRYWGLPVGEAVVTSARERAGEPEEEAIAAKLGEDQLRKQRQLILIAIDAQDGKAPSDRLVGLVVQQLRERKLLPTEYDFGASTSPAPL